MEKDYPFLTDYAKSNRSNCKGCKECISKDSLRIAALVQSPFFDGKMTSWYHFGCFFKKNSKLKSFEDIKNLDLLRWEDQERIKNAIKTEPVKSAAFSNYSVEYTKAKTSKCNKCQLIIEKGTVRISIKDSKILWHHIGCFHELKESVLSNPPDFDIEKLVGFSKLNEEDCQELKTKFKDWKTKKRAAEIIKEEEVIKKQSKLESKLEKKLKDQYDIIWKIRDCLERDLPKTVLVGLLEYNKQYVPKGESNLLNAVADCMVFGRINNCPDCGGMLEYSCNRYECKSNINEWTKCLYETKEVKRSEFKIPEEYLNYDIMNQYKFVKRSRILSNEPTIVRAYERLKGYAFCIDGGSLGCGYTQANVIKRINDLGGFTTKYLKDFSDCHVALISSGNIDNPRSFIPYAKRLNIDVVTPNFLNYLETKDWIDELKKHSCVDWGRDKDEILKLKNAYKPFQEHNNIKIEQVQTLTMKGGAVVDPDSGLEQLAHIYKEKKTNDPLTAILGMVDIVRGSNSFYKLQLLESDNEDEWWIFRSWGRIGTKIGGTKTEPFDNFEDAVDNFNEIYFDKTGNEWCNRHKFQKQPNRFYPMDVDYGESVTDRLPVAETSSSLPDAIQHLMMFVFDIESMKKAMLEFQIDLKKMPLGKLSKKQMQLSYSVLSELQSLLTQPEPPSKTKLVDATTRFYTLLPHDFGMKSPPLIDSLDVIKTKCDMIDNLMEIDIAFNLMNVGECDNKIDQCYLKLNNVINVVDRCSDTFSRIDKYVHNTHAATHDQYTLEIVNVFDLVRQNEEERFEKFRKMPNRMMLWHGSRRTNWAGILSQGLRIAPPEAPVTGYMFGKGIYFADMVSKSANYCYSNKTETDGLLLLCEVALGNMAKRWQEDTNIQLNEGENSCKGIGTTAPNPTENFIDEDGVVYPMGAPLTQKGVRGSLFYNEYIVYDVDQVRQRFLVQVKFKYKSRR